MTTEPIRTETVTWKTSTDKLVTVTVALARKITHLGTDEWTGKAITKDKGLEITTRATIEGMGEVGRHLQSCKHPSYLEQGLVAKIGKLGINAENLARINAARATLEETPEWQAQEAARAAHEAEMADLDAHQARMRRVMGH